MKEVGVTTNSEEESRALGRRLAEFLVPGDLIGLVGDLGAGKTAFVRGLAEGLGIPAGRVRSPTFTLINEYEGGRIPLFHIDLYRLEPAQVDKVALREYLYGDGVCVVEWFERLGDERLCLELHLTLVGAEQRHFVAVPRGARYGELLDRCALFGAVE